VNCQSTWRSSALASVFLEDSFVLSIRASERSITFLIDAVLTPQHPRYQPPNSARNNCLERSLIIFESDFPIDFEPAEWLRTVDDSDWHRIDQVTNNVDYGGVDGFVPVVWEGRPAWFLGGYWGDLLIAVPRIRYEVFASGK